jgi:hypothetical protein
MKFGIVDKVFYDEYLSDHVCSSCSQNYSTKLVIYCRAFATGFTWWAWKKRGYIECNSCGAVSDVKAIQHNARSVQSAFSRKSMPAYYYMPSILIGSVVALFIVLFGIGFVYGLFQTKEGQLQGIWEDRSTGNSLFVYKGRHYTLMNADTILFGEYSVDKKTGRISIPINEEDNYIDKVDPANLLIHLSFYEDARLVKTSANLRGSNPYEPKYNHWRIKADHSESPQEIKQRVLEYLRYVQMRYRWALKNELTYLPADIYSPVITAGNGIAIYESSMKNWAPVFYSEENLLLANKFLYLTFPSDIKYDVSEPNVYKRNLKGIDHYIQVAEATDIASTKHLR